VIMGAPKEKINVIGDVAYVPLTRGYYAIINADDVEKVERYQWHAMVRARTVYAVRSDYSSGKMKKIGMHRLIANAGDMHVIDHIDGDGLNNRSANLRQASVSQNCMNRRLAKNSTTLCKGVTFVAKEKKYWARIMANGSRVSLGYYKTAQEAAAAYVAASSQYHGEFGRAA
jgi:hypothetical protein